MNFISRHKILTALLILVIVMGGCLASCMRGPYHNYELDVLAPEPGAHAQVGTLEIGVAMRDITPNLDNYDPWVDVNENGKFDPGIDTYTDINGNGKFDGVWIAGFGTNRPATGVNDPQWARAMVLRNNGVTIALVTVDAIGLFHNSVIRARTLVDPALGIDHVIVSSTHSHEVADTMKIWSFWKRIRGLDIPIWGFDYDHMAWVEEEIAGAVNDAAANMQPAEMYCATVELPEEGFMRDSRKPHVWDPNMYLWRFTKPGTDETIATFVNWGMHPEAAGSRNTLLSSDFCHYLREGVEQGVPEPNGVEGLGGMCLYFQGMVGGLMTQLRLDIPHRDGVQVFSEDSLEKAQVQGENLAIEAVKALRDPEKVWKNEDPFLAYGARTLFAPMQGHFKWAIMLGIIHEGYYPGRGAKTEINYVMIGDVRILTNPGEIYPEIVLGKVEALPGRDFEIDPIEDPGLYSFMKGRQDLVIGLANDEIGYIIPKSQWDTKAPYVYGNSSQYGEGNSPGPEIGPAIYFGSRDLIVDMEERFAGQAE